MAFGSGFLKLHNYVDLVRHPHFTLIKKLTHGMLRAQIYATIYDEVRSQPDLPFVEIGAACGTATIAMAKGFQASGKTAKLASFERCVGGSRGQYGSFDDNYRMLKRNFDRFGVGDVVNLITRDLTYEGGESLIAEHGLERISGFMHDADGRVDRDFHLFWPKTVAGGLIIVDDYLPNAESLSIRPETPDFLAKRIAGSQILDILSGAGLFEPRQLIAYTMFGRKPAGRAHGEPLPKDVSDRVRAIGEGLADYRAAA